jgi:hypothetical protein
MTLQFVYWFLMLCLVLFHGWLWRGDPAYPWWNNLIPFILFLILGLQLFGFPIKH